MKKLSLLTVALLSLAAAPAAFADAQGMKPKSGAMNDMGHDAGAHNMNMGAHAAMNEAMADGEVKKIDKSAGKITIKHGPLENLGMPGMTMVFRVKDPAMLDQVKVGDRVRFRAEKAQGALTLTKLEAAQ